MASQTNDLTRSALIIVDMQNDFLHRDGVFGHMAKERSIDIDFLASTIPYARRLADAFRTAGRPVVYVVHVLKSDYSDAAFPGARDGAMREKQFIVEGTFGAKIVDELSPREGDNVIIKKGFGGFDHTELDVVLRNLGIDTCVVCGVTTCVCVSTTVRGAIARNYRAIIASDAVAEVNRETHAAELQTMARVFGEVRSTEEIMAMLAGPEPIHRA